MNKTKIEWCDYTWNPVTGCTKVSEGCRNCYAERMAKRFGSFDVTLHPNRLDEPLRVRKPARIFVCSMSDLFHEDVPFGFVEDVWTTLIKAPRHTFLVLTKRPDRMREFVRRDRGRVEFPTLSNVWLGVTVENQRAADERIPILLDTPAALRFVSVEPMLGPMDLVRWLPITYRGPDRYSLVEHEASDFGPMRFLDWVICGGETGPGARVMAHEWAVDLRRQCRSAGVPFFFKQFGGRKDKEWQPPAGLYPDDPRVREWPEVRS